jgi:quercetin dioxygenase-like cupin family protein
VTDFSVRRVVTQVHPDGSAGFASDGPPEKTISAPNGFGVSELLWFDGVPADRDAGRSRGREDADFPLEPPAGGMSSRIIRFPGGDEWFRVPDDDPAKPGMHTTDTLDLMVVLEGSIVLGLEGDEVEVGTGDVVIQRRTNHRWRTPTGCTYWVTMLRPDPSNPASSLTWATDAKSPVRRIVTDGAAAHDGYAPTALETAGVTLVDVWQTGGPLASATQGGDTGGDWEIEPAGGGVAMRWFEMPPARDVGPDVGWHTTATIDIDVVLSGRLALELPGGSRTELGAGDAVIQRGTDHRWLTLGDESARMAAVMFAVPS